MSDRVIDHDAREAVRTHHDVSHVIEAGAGTGKTTLLVDRIEALVRTGRARLDEIAAVTFTENAATTMKLRLRERLERIRGATEADQAQRGRAQNALDVLERASISTLHALCAAILAERPLECGVVPGFRVADEAEADLLFTRAWEEWLAERLAGDDELLSDALEAGIPLEGDGAWSERGSLRGLARVLVDQRDLEPLVGPIATPTESWRDALLERAAEARALVEKAAPDDRLREALQQFVRFSERICAFEGDALARALLSLQAIPRNWGQRTSWADADALERARQIAQWTRDAPATWKATWGTSLHARLVTALRDVAARFEQLKSEDGVLDYLDLLLKARNALVERESVRRHFRSRFRFVIIDEFQDTDPLQIEAARALAGDRAGALVVVGDAKQSIYRFRRAEVALMRQATREAEAGSGRVRHLTQSFRSRPAILRFVNRVFSELIQSSEATGQPSYEPLVPPPDLPDDASVVALRFAAPFAEKQDLLRAEADALARYVAQAARGSESVRDARGALRPSRAGDVMILSRRLTQIGLLEDALEAAGLRFAVEGGKSFFDRQEVHETLAVLRAIDDPTDRMSIVAALRSSFFGVSDRDLTAYVLSGGALWPRAADESLPGATTLAPALRLIEDLHRRRTRESVDALVERLYDETRILAALGATRRGEARGANLRKIASLARKSTDLGVLSLRGFARLLEQRVRDHSEEPDLPSARPGDTDALRILSIHKAKGLESPIVCLYDSDDNLPPGSDVIPVWDKRRVAIGLRAGCQPPSWETLREVERTKAEAEARRLLYVACTRARDRLVIPVPPSDARAGSFWRELTTRLPLVSDADVRVLDAETLHRPTVDRQAIDFKRIASADGGDTVALRWERERRELLDRGGRRTATPIAATRWAARSATGSVAGPAPGGGRDFGALVHRVLEWIPLDRPDHAAQIARALAPSFGVDEVSAEGAARMIERVLGLDLMDRARRSTRVWRELPLWLPLDGDLIEGVVDLVFEESGSLVVVDYKTDAITPEQALAQATHHAPQLQIYGRGLALATGIPVSERLVLFTSPGQAVPV